MPQRDHVCMYDEYMLCLHNYRPNRYNASMYVCVERLHVYVYVITDLDVATRKCMYVYMYVSASVIISPNQMLQRVSMYSVNFHG